MMLQVVPACKSMSARVARCWAAVRRLRVNDLALAGTVHKLAQWLLSWMCGAACKVLADGCHYGSNGYGQEA
jgi:hypothetical protein